MSVNGSTNWETFQVKQYLENDGDGITDLFNECADSDKDSFIEQMKDWVAEFIGMESEDNNEIVEQMKIAFWQSVDYDDLADSFFIENYESEEE